jgi:hypothetical protein
MKRRTLQMPYPLIIVLITHRLNARRRGPTFFLSENASAHDAASLLSALEAP